MPSSSASTGREARSSRVGAGASLVVPCSVAALNSEQARLIRDRESTSSSAIVSATSSASVHQSKAYSRSSAWDESSRRDIPRPSDENRAARSYIGRDLSTRSRQQRERNSNLRDTVPPPS